MGYTTNFEGEFVLDKPLTTSLKDFLIKLNNTRRMARNVGEEYGVEGEFFVGGDGFKGQNNEDNIIDYNGSPDTQPGLWCQWTPTEDGKSIEWDGGEKFYCYTEWLLYIIHKILIPNGYILNGEVMWQGEETGDIGKLRVKDNVVSTHEAFGGEEVTIDADDSMRLDVVYIDKAVEEEPEKVVENEIKNGDVFDIGQTVNGVSRFIMFNDEWHYFEPRITRVYEYDQKDLTNTVLNVSGLEEITPLGNVFNHVADNN